MIGLISRTKLDVSSLAWRLLGTTGVAALGLERAMPKVLEMELI